MRPVDPGDGLWRIRLFGTLTVERPDGVATALRGTRAGALLALLCLPHGRARSREDLAERLWPDLAPEVKRTRLRQEIAVLRGLFGDGADSPFVVARTDLRIDPERAWVDVAAFRDALAGAAATPDARIAALERAVALCPADLLPDYDEVEGERASLSAALEEALLELARRRRDRGEDAAALAPLGRLIERDPLFEEAHVERMRLFARMGQPTQVRRQYQELERALRDALGGAPSEATRRLRDTLLESAAPPPPAPPAPPSAPPAPPSAPPTFRPRGWAAAIPAAALLGLWALLSPRPAPTPDPAPLIPARLNWRYVDAPGLGELPNSEGTAMAYDGQGGAIVTGFVQTEKDDVDILTVHVDGRGRALWRRRWPNASHECDRAYGIVRDTGSREVTVVGTTYLPARDGWRLATLRYGDDGALRWERLSTGEVDHAEYGVRVVALPDGGVVVAGTARMGERAEIVVCRYDRDGARLWERRVPAVDGGETRLAQMARSPEAEGDILVCGTASLPSGPAGPRSDAFAACLDDAGRIRWRRRLGSPGPGEHRASEIGVDRFGFVTVFGLQDQRQPDGTGGFVPGLHRLRADTGQQEWARFKALDQPVVAPSGLGGNGHLGSVTYGAQSIGAGDRRTLTLRRYDPSGILSWERPLPLPAGYNAQGTQQVVVDHGDHHVLLGNLQRNSASMDAWGARLLPSGKIARQWFVPGVGPTPYERCNAGLVVLDVLLTVGQTSPDGESRRALSVLSLPLPPP